MPKDLKVGSVSYVLESRTIVIALSRETTRFVLHSRGKCCREDFESRLNQVRADLVDLKNGFVTAIVVTLQPQDPMVQGFLDGTGHPYDLALRCFIPGSGSGEDPFTGEISVQAVSQQLLTADWHRFGRNSTHKVHFMVRKDLL